MRLSQFLGDSHHISKVVQWNRSRCFTPISRISYFPPAPRISAVRKENLSRQIDYYRSFSDEACSLRQRMKTGNPIHDKSHTKYAKRLFLISYKSFGKIN